MQKANEVEVAHTRYTRVFWRIIKVAVNMYKKSPRVLDELFFKLNEKQ